MSEALRAGGEFPDRSVGGAAEECHGPKRSQILEGAREVFLAEGFDGASMGAIARAAGVSKGTLYVYFDSKEALFEALILDERRGLAEALFRLDERDPDVHSALRRLGLSYLEALGRPEHVSSVRMVIGAAEKFPQIGQVFWEAGPCQGIARLKAYLDAQVAQGRLSIEDTGVAAEQFLNLCNASLLKRLLFRAGECPTEAERESHVDTALRTFFAAFGPGARRPSA